MQPHGAYGFLIGSMLGLLSIVFGAFDAHAFRRRLAPDMLGGKKRAARYQMYHAFVKFVLDVVVVQQLG